MLKIFAINPDRKMKMILNFSVSTFASSKQLFLVIDENRNGSNLGSNTGRRLALPMQSLFGQKFP